jgi:hypothetical protein
MKVWENKIVPVSFAISSLLFLFAALKPVIKGQPLNVAFFCIGALCLVLAIATWRKSGGGTVPPNDA